jgi:hypothetical protein
MLEALIYRNQILISGDVYLTVSNLERVVFSTDDPQNPKLTAATKTLISGGGQWVS